MKFKVWLFVFALVFMLASISEAATDRERLLERLRQIDGAQPQVNQPQEPGIQVRWEFDISESVRNQVIELGLRNLSMASDIVIYPGEIEIAERFSNFDRSKDLYNVATIRSKAPEDRRLHRGSVDYTGHYVYFIAFDPANKEVFYSVVFHYPSLRIYGFTAYPGHSMPSNELPNWDAYWAHEDISLGFTFP